MKVLIMALMFLAISYLFGLVCGYIVTGILHLIKCYKHKKETK